MITIDPARKKTRLRYVARRVISGISITTL
jgi:hypothetical protein